MAITKIGHRAPYDKSRRLIGLYDESAGMSYDIFDTTDTVGLILAAEHEDVGLVTYYRADTWEDVWAGVGDDVELTYRLRGLVT